MDLRFNIVGMDKIIEKLEKLPDAIGDAGVEQANNYLLNVLIRKEIPPPKHVSRIEAYGRSFFTERQRRWFFAALKSGEITVPYKRRGPSGGVQSAWMISGAGRRAYLSNDDPAAEWVYSEHQARLNQLVGWRRVSQIIDKYTKNIVASFTRGVASAIKRLGL